MPQSPYQACKTSIWNRVSRVNAHACIVCQSRMLVMKPKLPTMHVFNTKFIYFKYRHNRTFVSCRSTSLSAKFRSFYFWFVPALLTNFSRPPPLPPTPPPPSQEICGGLPGLKSNHIVKVDYQYCRHQSEACQALLTTHDPERDHFFLSYGSCNIETFKRWTSSVTFYREKVG